MSDNLKIYVEAGQPAALNRLSMPADGPGI